MKLFHVTNEAKAIFDQGFKNGSGSYLTDRIWKGVWLSDQPLEEGEGAVGTSVLVLEIPEDVVTEYEWIEEVKPFREFLVPADVLNRFGPPSLFDDSEYLPPRFR